MYSVGERRHLRKQDAAEALREFFQEFEHSTHGMYEMLYGTSDDPENDPNIKQVLAWFNRIYRYSTYAITSFWLDDKTEAEHLKISINLTTGEIREEMTRIKDMKVPRKYRHATKKL